MIEQINKFLTSPYNHAEGFALVSKVCRNRHLVKRLERDSIYAREKIVYELQKYVSAPTEPKEPQPEAVEQSGGIHEYIEQTIEIHTQTIVQAEVERTPSRWDSADAGMNALIKERADVSIKRAKLSNTLADYRPEDNEGRKGVIDKIGELSKEKARLSKEIKLREAGTAAILMADHPAIEKKTKKKNVKPVDLTAPMHKLVQQRLGYRSSISRWRKKLETLPRNSEEYNQMARNIAQATKNINAIDEQLTKAK